MPVVRIALALGLALSFGLGLGFSADASEPKCKYSYWGGDKPIDVGDGFKVIAHKAQYHSVQIYADIPARTKAKRRPAYDGGPMVTTYTEIAPSRQARQQRKLVRAGYFVIKDHEGDFVGQFNTVRDVTRYVCTVLIPNLGT